MATVLVVAGVAAEVVVAAVLAVVVVVVGSGSGSEVVAVVVVAAAAVAATAPECLAVSAVFAVFAQLRWFLEKIDTGLQNRPEQERVGRTRAGATNKMNHHQPHITLALTR